MARAKPLKMRTSAEIALSLLASLEEARLTGDEREAHELERELDGFDAVRGYQRRPRVVGPAPLSNSQRRRRERPELYLAASRR